MTIHTSHPRKKQFKICHFSAISAEHNTNGENINGKINSGILILIIGLEKLKALISYAVSVA